MALLKKIWKNNSKHKKLSEEWGNGVGSQLSLTPMVSEGGRHFNIKYVGAAPAERACSAPATAAAVKQAVAQAKCGGKKMRRVNLTVSPKGILVEDATTSERILDVSIFRISYCSTDAVHSQVFAFIAQGPGESLECHAFLCSKRKIARAVTLAAAHSFNAAYQLWQSNQDKKRTIEKTVKSPSKISDELLSQPPTSKALLIDLFSGDNSTSPWVSFDEDGSCDLWDDAPAAQLLNQQLVS